MAKNLTLRGILSLNTRGFEKSVKAVRSHLNGLRNSFAAFAATLGAGYGIGALVKQFGDITTTLNKAEIMLKNVSSGGKEYAETYTWLTKMADQYNQQLTVLIENYAKFHSAANGANVALADQKKIYESFTRAGAFYGMSQDAIGNVFLALEQMMSKGKITAEELRRQMGNALPGAFTLFAKAAGMSMSEFEDAMRKGQVLSADILPKVADELNKITKSIDVNTIAGLKNAIQNEFAYLSKSAGMENLWKGLLKGFLNAVKTIEKDWKHLINVIGSTAVGIGAGKLFSGLNANFQKEKKLVEDYNKQIQKTNKLAAEFVSTSKGKNPNAFFSVREDNSLAPEKWHGLDVSKAGKHGLLFTRDLNESQVKQLIKELEKADKILQKLPKSTYKLTQSTSFATASANLLKRAWIGVKTTIQAAMSSIAIGAAIAGIQALINHLIGLAKEAKRVKNIFNDYKKAIEDATNIEGNNEDIQLIKMYQDLVNQNGNKKSYIDRLNELLGLQGDNMLSISSTQDEINKAIEREIELRKQLAKQSAYENEYSKAKIAYEKKYQEYEAAMSKQKSVQRQMEQANGNSYAMQGLSQASLDANKEVQRLKKELDQLQRVLDDTSKHVRDMGNAVKSELDSEIEGYLAWKEQQEASLSSAEKTLTDSLRRLDKQKGLGMIDSKEFDAGKLKAYEKYINDLLDLDIEPNPDFLKEFKRLKAVVESAGSKTEKLPLEKELEDYRNGVAKLDAQLKNGYITSKEYRDELNKLQETSWETISGLDDLEDEIGKLGDEAGKAVAKLKNEYLKNRFSDVEKKARAEAYNNYDRRNDDFKNPTKGTREIRFDYEKELSDVIGENYDISADYIEKLKQKIENLKQYTHEDENGLIVINDDAFEKIQEFRKELAKAVNEAVNLNEAMTLAKINEDITEMQAQLRKGAWSSFKDTADAVERMSNGFKSMKETLEDSDSTGFEKLLAILNEIIQTIDSVGSVVEGFRELSKLSNTISQAKQFAAMGGGAQAAALSEELLGDEALATASKIAGARTLEIAAAKELAYANGAAGAMAIPFPANIPALNQVMAELTKYFAMSKGLQMFANGGVVGGSKGEHPVLAHAGEVVLNAAQQRNLANNIGSGKVEFKISGKNLIGVLDSYNKIKNGGR